MRHPVKSQTQTLPAGAHARRGFVLFFVCVFALMMMVLLIGLNVHKSGEILQLSRSIEQERIVFLVQAGINEMLAGVKAGVNDRNTQIGREIAEFWKLNPAGGNKVIYEAEIPAARLPVANGLVRDYLGASAEISGRISITVIDKIAAPRPSYIGYLEIVGKAKSRDVPEIRLKERREIRIVDLSYPFVDKYALFVKSFCRQLSHPKKKIIVKGIAPDDPGIYSYVYLGNRSYPPCPEFPQGAKSAKTPPVLLDLFFRDDHHLLGSFYRPAPFQTVDPRFEQVSAGNFFFVIPPFDFKTIANSYSVSTDFHNTPELVNIYKSILKTSSNYAGTEGTLGYMIAKDYQKAGGNPGNSEVFRSMVYSLMQNWKYQYGYTDYASIAGDSGSSFVKEHPFSGIGEYFVEYSTRNPQRLVGGKMPVLFGEGRDIPVYVEGPVFLRFFKIAFLDQAKVKFELFGGETMDVTFPPVPLFYEEKPETFAGKTCSPQIDERTKVLMSAPIESLSVNNLFFGANVKKPKTPTSVSGGVEGYDVFPAFDPTLRSVAHLYKSVGDFVNERIKMIGGKKVLDLDGVSMILDPAGAPLDLSSVEKYRGKGRIILQRGNCIVGNLSPISLHADTLGIYLMFGNIVVKSSASVVSIYASLAASTNFRDNSSSSVSAESGIDCGGKSVNIYGNLFVDNLFDLRTLPDGGKLTIVHDPNLYFPAYPVRVSIGEARSLMAVDYDA